MPPKRRISRDDIIAEALSLVRARGAEALNARSVSKALSCSTQPIFSNFATMTELKKAVADECEAAFTAYIKAYEALGKYPAYKAYGMAYISYAKEERECFKLLFMRDRSREKGIAHPALNELMVGAVVNAQGLERDKAQIMHLEMWAFVHGIASMTATGYLELSEELISRMLTDAFQGLLHRFS